MAMRNGNKILLIAITAITAIIALLFFGLPNEHNFFINEDSKKFKKIVNEVNPEPIKKIGDIKQEFLNEDNLYENYVYNYTIKFPENFKLNYGLGEYSNILGYDEINGRQIAVSTGKNSSFNFSSQQEVNKYLTSLTENHLEFYSNELIKNWTSEGSYQSMKAKDVQIVSFF